MATQEPRLCAECGVALRGRADQRFCSAECRTGFHNRQKLATADVSAEAFVRKVNGLLRRNRQILRGANPDGKARVVSGAVLRAQGFRFGLYTHQYQTRKGDVYFFCYEQGYLPLPDDAYALVVNDRLPG